MTSGILAASASSEMIATSLRTTTNSNGAVSAVSRTRSTSMVADDSVQLSAAAEQYLSSPKPEPAAVQHSMVEQLVRAAAAGDMGAMALLTIA